MHHIIILVLCLALLAASFLFNLQDDAVHLLGLNWPFRCFMYHILGVKCALCGLTRSFCALTHADWSAAITFHPLGPFIFAFICLQIPYRITAIIIRPKKMNRTLTKINLILVVILVSAIFVNWFVYLGGLLL